MQYPMSHAFHTPNPWSQDRCSPAVPQTKTLHPHAVVFGAALFAAVLQPHSAGLAGLAITSALQATGLMSWAVRQTTEMEVWQRVARRGMRVLTGSAVPWVLTRPACEEAPPPEPLLPP